MVQCVINFYIGGENNEKQKRNNFNCFNYHNYRFINFSSVFPFLWLLVKTENPDETITVKIKTTGNEHQLTKKWRNY